MSRGSTKDHYATLGLSGSDCCPRAVRKAYRRQAMKLHPDKHVGEAAKAKAAGEFIKLSRAYDTLKCPKKRKEYDATRPRSRKKRDVSWTRTSAPEARKRPKQEWTYTDFGAGGSSDEGDFGETAYGAFDDPYGTGVDANNILDSSSDGSVDSGFLAEVERMYGARGRAMTHQSEAYSTCTEPVTPEHVSDEDFEAELKAEAQSMFTRGYHNNIRRPLKSTEPRRQFFFAKAKQQSAKRTKPTKEPPAPPKFEGPAPRSSTTTTEQANTEAAPEQQPAGGPANTPKSDSKRKKKKKRSRKKRKRKREDKKAGIVLVPY